MIDVHSHIVFGVDDGPTTIEESVEILKEAYNEGFKKIIVTPHYIENYYEKDKDEIAKRISDIKIKLQEENCFLEILQGNEIYITEDICQLIDSQKVSTLGNSQYVLFELPLNAETLNLNKVVYQLLENEKIPVLAHPERYPFVKKDVNELLPLIEIGVKMQCNYGSILGQYGNESKQTIKKMLSHNMVHLLGSDVHRSKSIYLKIGQAMNEIKKIVGVEKLQQLTNFYPEQIINGEKIETDDPIKVKQSIWKKIF